MVERDSGPEPEGALEWADRDERKDEPDSFSSGVSARSVYSQAIGSRQEADMRHTVQGCSEVHSTVYSMTSRDSLLPSFQDMLTR